MKKILIIAISVVCILLLFMTNSTYKDEKDYLSKNHTKINLESTDDFTGLDILKKDLKNKSIILTGEEHRLNKNTLMSIKMLKYLNQEIGVNYYLGEMPSTDAYFINKYLESGDESILKQVFNYNKGTAADNIDDYNFYKEIYKYNKTLDIDSKIKIIGIDIEHSGISSYDYILDIVKEKDKIPEKLHTLLKYLKIRDLTSINSSIEELMKDINLNEGDYKNLFEDDFDDFKHTLNNIKAMCISYMPLSQNDMDEWNNVRDKYIYENFKYMDSKLENPKYFGQWGGAHIYKEAMNFSKDDVEFIASYLNKDEKYKDKVLSIQYGYYNPDITYNSYPIDKDMFGKYLDSSEDCLLFKLNSKNSPFSEEFLYPIEYKPTNVNNFSTTDYFDYVLLIKGAYESDDI